MRACDLCGCYTPQLESLPQTAAETPFGQPIVTQRFLTAENPIVSAAGRFRDRSRNGIRPGRCLILGAQFVVSGEHKDVDRFRGKRAEDTGITSTFVGPRVVASFGKFSAEIGVDLPVSIENTALQVVPDYRIRGGISMRF